MFTEIGKERGWPPTRRAHFDALLGSTGALIIGDAKTVADKSSTLTKSSAGFPASTCR